jgi:hypothetical protein
VQTLATNEDLLIEFRECGCGSRWTSLSRNGTEVIKPALITSVPFFAAFNVPRPTSPIVLDCLHPRSPYDICSLSRVFG